MEQIFWTFAVIYLIGMNLAGFLSMKADKERARKKKWRIKERTLFGIALLGGSFGSLLGMRLFHHKTKHWYFAAGMPAILLLQSVLAGILIFSYSR